MDMINISVLWVTRNRCDELIRSIESVFDQTRLPDELVVVDNASEDNTVHVLSIRFPEIKIIRMHRNIGCPAARNIGVANCAGEIVYFLDDDGWLDMYAIENALNVFITKSNVAVVSSRLIHVADHLAPIPIIEDSPSHLQACFNGGCSSIRRKIFIECGGFPDDFFRQAEEVSLSLYLIDKGYDIFYEPTSIMYHKPSAVERMPLQFTYLLLSNSIKIGYRQVPFPYWPGKVIIQMWYCLRESVSHRNFFLFIKLLIQSLIDIPLLFSQRKPVSREAFKKYLHLNKQNRIEVLKCD
jgi:GT2 family glycosyltransferase